MRSKHASTLILFLGAFAFVICLSGVLTLKIAEVASGQVAVAHTEREPEVKKVKVTAPPRIVSRNSGGNVVVAEVDKSGSITKTIWSSTLGDIIGDFSVFAVPQDHFAGKVYVQTIADSSSPILKVYPLEVETGKLGASLFNVEYTSVSLSPNQETIAVENTTSLTLYSLSTGNALQSFLLNEDEVWSKEKGSWTSLSCYDQQVWYSQVSLETRSFCIN